MEKEFNDILNLQEDLRRIPLISQYDLIKKVAARLSCDKQIIFRN